MTLDPAKFEAAGARFVAFFSELGRTFVEREELLTQIALGLLSREHVLMTGPPGTAKSGVASAVLRRVLDEKSGAPSLFARQFTESTVQTDLVGPINFKTLMETGRTEHFTDEGMLGAVHAFLDEVFDGRDMLLRSTLNVLQERELKEGSKTTRGQIECALMTTNRYLAEVLEGSRETLLAFVDRIAFVCFVPRGFANAETLENVLKRQIQPGAATLGATLTIQDLDVLQEAAESVDVPDEVLAALAKLLGFMEIELAAAERADPQFLPTRYLSTRTAVRLGRLLRAVCIYDRLFTSPKRELEVDAGDLRGVRLSLVLGGPKPAELASLLDRETDARERRQLSIIRTEREIFERCFLKLPPIKIARKKVSPATARLTSVASAPQKVETGVLVDAAKALALQPDAAKPTDVQKLLAATIAELSDRALRAGLTAGAADDSALKKTVDELVELAANVESATTRGRALGRWLRGRALLLVEESAVLAGANTGESLEHLVGERVGISACVPMADKRLAVLEELMGMRDRLRVLGAEEGASTATTKLWAGVVARAQDDVAAILDVGFQSEVAVVLASAHGEELEAVLKSLDAPLDVLDRYGKKLATFGGSATELKALVAAPRLRPLVAAAFERMTTPDRVKLVTQIDRLLAMLTRMGLQNVLAPRDLLAMTATTLVRCARSAAVPALRPLDLAQYRRLRKADQRVPGAFTLLELSLRFAPGQTVNLAEPQSSAAALVELARDLPDELAREVALLDLERLERATSFLEQWGASLNAPSQSGADTLRGYAKSGFFHVLTDEQTLLRTALELRLVRDVFPVVASSCDALRERINTLEKTSYDTLRALLDVRSKEAWASMLTVK